MRRLQHSVKNENGSTLVETLVAMAILVSVLLPISMFLGYIANNPQNKEEIQALGLAQSEMETTLAVQNYQEEVIHVGDQWTIEKKISKEGNSVQIMISVRRPKQQKTLITLTTERLLYDETIEK